MNIKEYIQNHLLYLDGGMGTLLQEKNILNNELPERLNITHPDIITEIHTNYFNSGSNVVSTNTFGANSLKFSLEELDTIIKAAVDNAQKAKQNSTGEQEKWIALDVGPTGKMLAPYGDLDFEDAVTIFANTIKLGVKYGVDLILIETMNDSYETKAALLAAKENSNLPVFVSNSYGEDGKLMTGASPEAIVAMLEGMNADAIGVNCSLGPKALEDVVTRYLNYSSTPIILKPNAGLPKSINNKTVFDISPESFALEIKELIKKGVRICGGCCGTTPEYIRELVNTTSSLELVPITEKNITCVSSYTHAVTFGNKPILIGERINPTGKKLFKEALKNNDINYILQEGINQQEKGVDILDVNVGLPEINEVNMLKTAVCELQAIINLPLQIDTSDAIAMEVALRRYNGKAMINSVSGKQEVMDVIFPLAKKYGGLIVALTLDDDGIPTTFEQRIRIVQKILSTAKSYGIDKKDIIFDPLALTISADKTSARETLKTVDFLHTVLDCNTSLGISNVSFGLPRRELINSAFFLQALTNGLTAAIINPYSEEIMTSYYTFCCINGLDDNCNDYINYAQNLPTKSINPNDSITATDTCENTSESELQNAIVKGLKEKATTITSNLIKTIKPLDLIQQDIIPALNIVGTNFENKTMYLPQLLMSAEAAKATFDVIKSAFPTDNSSSKGPIIIATVKGDIHDIGKNIVKLLLENYGYQVIDLGRDISPEAICEATITHHAPLVGLSALMTTTVPAMEETIKLLRKEAPWCKIIVGGAVLTKEYADSIGADMYAKDALAAVRYAEKEL